MANLKEKILQALKNSKQMDSTISALSQSQENLLKNHSNPVFNKTDRNKILKEYTNLQNIGESLYKYNTLQTHNHIDSAEEEKKNIETTVLKGGVSYNKYVWHSENGEHTCEYCADLDGKEFDFYDEVPERPHPHCRCYVEIIEEGNGNPSNQNKEEEEPCDCIVRLLYWQEECNNANLEIENLIQEAEDTKLLLEEFIEYLLNYSNDNIIEYINELYNLIQNVATEVYGMISQVIQTIQIFYKNWNELITVSKEVGHYVNYSAEYYHTKANCEAAQLGDVGEKVATILGYAREGGDIIKDVLVKHQTLEQAFKNSIHDLEVNEEGRRLGKENPNADPRDIIIQPKDLPKKHW